MPGAQARFSVDDSRLEGVILARGEWYYFEPLRNYSPDAAASELAVYRRSDIVDDAIGICGTTLAHRIGDAREFAALQVTELAAGSYSAEVATEADYEYVTWCGGSAAANADILDIMNQVSGIYETDLGISLQVSYQHTWTTASDPYNSTEASGMLDEFRNHWNSNFYSVSYDIAHMWTGKDMEGSTVGIAYLGVVCSMRSYGYGISQKFSSAPGKYVLSAHEIGHNFGASHTDQASPPQPDCSNTIMNSFVVTETTFCPFSRTEISGHVAQSSSCLASGPAAPSALAATAISGSQINLTWQDNSGNETGFRVERRQGSGSWQVAGVMAANTTSLSDTGLAAGATYFVSSSGSGIFSQLRLFERGIRHDTRRMRRQSRRVPEHRGRAGPHQCHPRSLPKPRRRRRQQGRPGRRDRPADPCERDHGPSPLPVSIASVVLKGADPRPSPRQRVNAQISHKICRQDFDVVWLPFVISRFACSEEGLGAYERQDGSTG